MTSTVSPTLSVSVCGTGEPLRLSPSRLVIAGYTARDQAAVRAHIEELEHIGVPPPPRVPMFYEVPVELATSESSILVDGDRTSGEAEPVLIRHGGRSYLGLGSDHTDREVEKRDIAESKASAPKPLADRVVPLETVMAAWDEIELVCRLDGEQYQRGRLSSMLHPDEILDRLAAGGRDLGSDALMFCGTLPLDSGSFVYGTSYHLEMRLPDGTVLSHAYDVKRKGE